MENQDYQVVMMVGVSPKEAFNCINNVTKWWTENLEGHTQKLHDEFTVRFADVHYSKQKLIEVVNGKKVVWLVTESSLNFIEEKNEWTGTRISFEISGQEEHTNIVFRHEGLTSEKECFNACSDAWGQYLRASLVKLIETGRGKPEPRERSKAAQNK